MSEPQPTSTSIKSPATRARRGAVAVIAQYVHDLSEVQATLGASQRPAGRATSPCAA